MVGCKWEKNSQQLRLERTSEREEDLRAVMQRERREPCYLGRSSRTRARLRRITATRNLRTLSRFSLHTAQGGF